MGGECSTQGDGGYGAAGAFLTMAPWLSQDEVDDFCKPLTQAAAQIRFLRSFGLTVRTKPCGAALVMRTHFEDVMNRTGKGKRNAEASRPQPNWAGLALIRKQA